MRSKTETIPCKYCGYPTPMLGTKLCNGCWEVCRHIRDMKKEVVAAILENERLQEHWMEMTWEK